MTLDVQGGRTSSTNEYETHSQKTFDSGPKTLENVRNETYEVVLNAMQSDGATLVDAMPAAGKSYSTYEAAAEVNKPISYLTERTVLYDEAKDEFEERGLQCKILPSPYRDCPTFMGEHGDEWENKVDSLYKRGVSGGDIHIQLSDKMPCHSDCPYSDEWDFEPEQYDVIIAHYKGAYVSDKLVDDRIVVVDEFAEDGYTHEFENPQSIVTHFLEQRPGIPFDNWGGLTEERDSEAGREAINWFQNNPRNLSTEEVIESDSQAAHALAGRLVISLLTMTDLGNGFEVSMSNDGVCVRSQESDKMWLLDPPELGEAESIVGLDGTPSPTMWDTAFGEEFDVRKVVPDDEKDHYVHDILNLSLYEPEFAGDGGMKPYHSKRNITTPKDESKLFGLQLQFGEKPALISTASAVGGQDKTGLYETEGVVDRAGLTKNYSNIHSSNEFKKYNVGMVSGCPRPSDDVIKRWVALMGISTEREGRGNDVEFTNEYGNEVFRHYVHGEVLQAILRFSRDGDGCHVLVNTTATPDWLTTDDVDLPATSPGEREIIKAMKVADDPLSQDMLNTVTDVSVSRISEILTEFKSDGLVSFSTDENGTLCYSWTGSA